MKLESNNIVETIFFKITTWFAFEEIARTVMDCIGVDSNKIKYKSEVTNETQKKTIK